MAITCVGAPRPWGLVNADYRPRLSYERDASAVHVHRPWFKEKLFLFIVLLFVFIAVQAFLLLSTPS